MTPSTEEPGLYDEREPGDLTRERGSWKQQWSREYNMSYWQNTENSNWQEWLVPENKIVEPTPLTPPFQDLPEYDSSNVKLLRKVDEKKELSLFGKEKWGKSLADDHNLQLPEGADEGDYVEGCRVIDLPPINGLIPKAQNSKAWMRTEYIRIIRAIEAHDNIYNTSDQSINFITGQPGLGKTIFSGCLLRYRLAFRKPTIFVHTNKECFVFCGSVYSLNRDNLGTLLDRYNEQQKEANRSASPIWIINNARIPVHPLKLATAARFRIVHCTSPDALLGLNQMRKDQHGPDFEWFCNPWSTWELCILYTLVKSQSTSLLLSTQYFPHSRTELEDTVKTLTGPIPRTLVNMWVKGLTRTVIETKMTSAIDQFPTELEDIHFTVQKPGGEKSRQTPGRHRLLLYRRQSSLDRQMVTQGPFNFLNPDDTPVDVSFLSDFAADKVYESLIKWNVNHRSEFLRACFGIDACRSLASALFEREFHNLNGPRELDIHCMERKGPRSNARYTIPREQPYSPSETLVLENIEIMHGDELATFVKMEENRLQSNNKSSKLFIPSHKNKGIDSFALSRRDDGRLVGWCIQETVAKQKPAVKLEYITENLRKVWGDMEFRLLFALACTRDLRCEFECSSSQFSEGEYPFYTYFNIERNG